MPKKQIKNKNLHKAKTAKNDEFYTQITDIEKELGHYKNHFKNKIVFCNCDDPKESNFWKYFALNFEVLGLKKLISTHFETTQPSYKLEIEKDINGDGKIDEQDAIKTSLKQNGDFRSPECIDILKESDIVVTNPPFSLFREYVNQLIEYDKKFIIIGNINAITYKDIFGLIKEDKIWLGCSIHSGDREFRVPDSYPLYAAGSRVDEQGNKYIRVKGVRWFTNLDYKERHEDLILYKKYTKKSYPKYDNYNAINVNITNDIPMNYDGVIGVPITFIDLFAGIGGFRIALEEQGFKCVFSSEWDKHSQKTYFENFKEMPYGDITKLRDEDIGKTIPAHDILCGGFPCQAFSISGKQKGFEDTRGTLFFDIVRIAKARMPKILFLENVKNFKKHDGGKTFEKVMAALHELGYNAFAKVLNASHYGAPTSRERIYFVCFRKDLGITSFNFPEQTLEKIYLKDYLEKEADTTKFEINRPDINFYKEKEQPLALNPIQIGTINKGGQGERIYSINGHAITLSAHGGGAASKTGAYLINNKVRKLTPRECARVMGFPEDFKIPVSKSQAYKQFGNSVSIQVLKAVIKKINEKGKEI